MTFIEMIAYLKYREVAQDVLFGVFLLVCVWVFSWCGFLVCGFLFV